MGGATEFCRYPGDLEGCMACLIEAYRAGTIEEHCIMIGLQHGHPQCLHILARNMLTGPVLKPRTPGSQEPYAALPPLLLACQMALHLGYQRDLPGAKAAFVQAYKDLVGSKLRGYPQADANDIFQEVFLAMEKRLRNPAPINGMMSAYIGTVTDNAIRRFLGKQCKQGRLRADADLAADVVDEMPEGYGDIPMGLAELWENCDRILASSERTDFVDRVIFAQGFVCSGEADRIPTKNILMLWRSLAEGNMTSVASIAAEAAARLALSHDTAVVWIATDMLRESRLEPWQLPVVLGLDAKMEPHEVVGLFRKLANKSVGFIDQRAPRIQRLLASHIRHGRQSGRRE